MTTGQLLKHDFSKGNLFLYDDKGNEIYFENSDGYWFKREYDDVNDNEFYFENSYGYWYKYDYDVNGNDIYFEDSDGYWYKYDYDVNGNEIYFEDSNGVIEDNQPKGSCNGKVVEIEGKRYQLNELV